ncbi:MAG: ComEA family DNA-binding protein, partial [Candidatus Cloacimonetes bacterium]|nr:ComEA family DNA-binding protein [Candidatus Cloacimonadota bacterium]
MLDHRAAHPFTSVTQLLDVRGIGPKTFARLLPSLVSFGDSALVNRITAQNLADLNSPSSAAVAANLTPGKPKRAPAAKAIPKGELTNIVNLNSAGLEELCTLPGIGEVKAAAIIAWRKQNGAFQSVDDLLKVSGIGPKTLAKIRHRL